MPGLTRTAVRTRIREMLAEPDERYFTDCAINTWIDDGVRDVSIKTFCNTRVCELYMAYPDGYVSYCHYRDKDYYH